MMVIVKPQTEFQEVTRERERERKKKEMHNALVHWKWKRSPSFHLNIIVYAVESKENK
jgi:hypothetical protein